MSDKSLQRPGGEFLLYQAEDGRIRIETRLLDETIWLSINQMGELFGVDKSGVSRHLKNIFESGELSREATVAKFATVQVEGSRTVTRDVEYYNLDAIISVGYRVNSIRGTRFRMWATERIKEYIVKGFAMDDERLKEAGGGTYFEELLARIRDIRSSEKVFWRKVLDIYATSIDYDPHADISQEFFKVVQNKMHWAAHGHTAAEIIAARADAERPNMGLTNWPHAVVRKADVGVAKNYLKQEELAVLNRMVSAYLEVAEIQALNRVPMYMKDWVERLDDFLRMTGKDILAHAGSVSHEAALARAEAEYDRYHRRRLLEPAAVEKHFQEAMEECRRIEKHGSRSMQKRG